LSVMLYKHIMHALCASSVYELPRPQALADAGDAATAEEAANVAAAAPRPAADDDPEEEYGWEAQNLAHATNYHCMFEPNMLSAAVSALGEADYHAAHGHVLNQ